MTPFKSIASTRDLPPAPSGWHPHGVTATGDGRVALLRAREPVPRGQPDAATLERLHRTNMRVSAFDGDEETEVVELPFLRFGRIVDRFEDGRWVVDGWNGLTEPADATRIHAPDGRLLSAFEIGGRHAACAGEHLWVGYGDEEIFGNDPDASAGLAAFDATGRCVHKFRHPGISIDECYALGSHGREVWACTYSDFPILRLVGGLDPQVTVWENDVTGATAIATSGSHVVLAGGYWGDETRVVLLRLEPGRAIAVDETRLPREAFAPSHTNMIGRAGALHVFSAERWMRVDVAEWAARVDGRRGRR